MQAHNLVVLAGNLTRDPELRYTPKGAPVCDFTLALNSSWKTDTGEKREDVSFIDCNAWNATAELIQQYLHKGDPLLIDGKLKQQTWDDKQTGAKRSKIIVVVDRITFIGGGKRNDEDAPAPAPAPRKAPTKSIVPGTESEPSPIDEDDIPF